MARAKQTHKPLNIVRVSNINTTKQRTHSTQAGRHTELFVKRCPHSRSEARAGSDTQSHGVIIMRVARACGATAVRAVEDGAGAAAMKTPSQQQTCIAHASERGVTGP